MKVERKVHKSDILRVVGLGEELDAYPLDKPIPRLPDMYLWWPGKEDGKPCPPIMWLDDKPERRDE